MRDPRKTEACMVCILICQCCAEWQTTVFLPKWLTNIWSPLWCH